MAANIRAVSPEQFEERSEAYFDYCLENEEPPTASGLAWHLGFASRQSLWDYKKDDAYKQLISRAMLFVEYGYERQMANGRGDGGIVFALKNFGWTDKQELAHTSPDGSMSPKGKTLDDFYSDKGE
jgi:hypothetical protein